MDDLMVNLYAGGRKFLAIFVLIVGWAHALLKPVGEWFTVTVLGVWEETTKVRWVVQNRSDVSGECHAYIEAAALCPLFYNNIPLNISATMIAERHTRLVCDGGSVRTFCFCNSRVFTHS